MTGASLRRLPILISGLFLLCGVLLSACALDAPRVAVSAGTISEKPRQLLEVEKLFSESAVNNVRLSPDGKLVAFIKQFQGVNNLFLLEVGQHQVSESAQPVTRFQQSISSFKWAGDSQSLFFQMDQQGDENFQIYQIEIADQSVAKRLTPKTDRRYMMVQQAKKQPHLINLLANHDHLGRFDAYQLDIRSGKLLRVLKNDQAFGEVLFDDQGEVIAGLRVAPDSSTALLTPGQSSGNAHWQTLLASRPGETLEPLKYLKTSNSLYLTANLGAADKSRLLKLDLANGELETIHLDPLNQSDIYRVIFDQKNQLLAVSYYGARQRLYSLDRYFEKHWDIINQSFDYPMEIRIESVDQLQGIWQFVAGSDIHSDQNFLYNSNTETVTPLLQMPQPFSPELLSARQSINYPARDGELIQAYLTMPESGTGPFPTVVLPHGGPWARDYWTLSSGYFNAVAQLLANRGYVVLQPNFRASTGFGKRFMNLGDRQWGTGQMQHDLTAGVEYLIQQKIADPNRLAIMGASYGGYATLAGITFTPDLYQAAISYVGPSSLLTLVASFPEYFRPYLGQWFRAVGDPQVEADVADMQSRSPINFVDQIKTPLLLIQGANDPRVTQAESDAIAKAMYQKSLPVEYILAKDEGHGFYKQDNKIASFYAIEDFLAQHLHGVKTEKISVDHQQHWQSLKVDLRSL